MTDIDLSTMTEEQLDDHRRAVASEQERRDKVTAGPARVGATLRDYLAACGKTLEGSDEDVGQAAIDAVLGDPHD